MARLDDLFRHLKEGGGSYLHPAAEREPRVRIHGALAPVPGWEKSSDVWIGMDL